MNKSVATILYLVLILIFIKSNDVFIWMITLIGAIIYTIILLYHNIQNHK